MIELKTNYLVLVLVLWHWLSMRENIAGQLCEENRGLLINSGSI